jgi:hypothetical protein
MLRQSRRQFGPDTPPTPGLARTLLRESTALGGRPWKESYSEDRFKALCMHTTVDSAEHAEAAALDQRKHDIPRDSEVIDKQASQKAEVAFKGSE